MPGWKKEDVPPEPVVNLSGSTIPANHPSISPARPAHTRIDRRAMTGDAPKDFLRIYEYGAANRSNPKRWPAYIAKVGKKWYPNESITEHLLTRVGQAVGIPIADSRLMTVRGQLRFMSRYFLRPDESLVHGADIFADFLNDQTFVDQVEQENREREVFTFQVVEEAVLDRFGEQSFEIICAYVRLIAFDALVGNNDRHFYNWGVITDIRGRRAPKFSPVYDTARGLFWNTPDSEIQRVLKEKREAVFLKKYVEKSTPKTSWDNDRTKNHFSLVEKIATERSPYAEGLRGLDLNGLEQKFTALLDGEFEGLFTDKRKAFMIECLRMRAERLSGVLSLLP